MCKILGALCKKFSYIYIPGNFSDSRARTGVKGYEGWAGLPRGSLFRERGEIMAHSYDVEESSMERHIHYNKRGELQMVGQKSLFDLDEPVWHADEKVRQFLLCVCVCVGWPY